MSDLELAKKLRRARKNMLELAAHWELELIHDPVLRGAIDDAKASAQRYLLQLRTLRNAA